MSWKMRMTVVINNLRAASIVEDLISGSLKTGMNTCDH